MTPMHSNQRGFAAIAAIFLLVVLAALGGFMLSFSNTQQLTSAQDVQGSRAYWAAHAGLEWALATVDATSACPGAAPTPIQGFIVEVTCALPSVYSEGGVDRTIFRLQSTARSGGGASVGSVGYIERSLSATVEN